MDTSAPTLTDAAPVPAASGKSERFIIRDKQQRLRVDGRVDNGRMTGQWVYYDSKGEKLALVTYRLDERHGPVQLFYVSADGPAVGRTRMTGSYINGSPNGTMASNWPAGGKKLEREFDQGILQGAKGWTEKGARMADGEAMRAGIEESRNEEALLTELENFVQLQMRKRAASRAPAEKLPDAEPAPLGAGALGPVSSPMAGGGESSYGGSTPSLMDP